MDFKKINELLDKYFEGKSSTREERLLREYFSKNKNIPGELKYAAEMFGYFKKESLETLEKPQTNKTKTINRNYIAKIAAVAASLLLIAGLMFLIPRPEEKVVYAYINGEPVTDKEVAFQETKKALDLLSDNLDKSTEGLHHLSKFNEVKELTSKKQ